MKMDTQTTSSPGPSFSKVLIPIVVLILLVVGYGTFAKNYHWWPHNTDTPRPTDNWQTYQNTSLGITFQVPANWTIKETDGPETHMSTLCLGESNRTYFLNGGYVCGMSVIRRDISEIRKGESNNLTANEIIQQRDLPDEVFVLDGEKAMTDEISILDGKYTELDTLVDHADYTYWIGTSFGNDLRPTYMHILSTFKFTN